MTPPEQLAAATAEVCRSGLRVAAFSHGQLAGGGFRGRMSKVIIASRRVLFQHGFEGVAVLPVSSPISDCVIFVRLSVIGRSAVQ
jgi:hypothetical protein